MNKRLEISRYIYIFGISLIPFFVIPSSYTPYTLGKTTLLAGIIFLSFLLFVLSKPKEYKIPHPVILVLILLEIFSNYFNFNFFMFPRYSENYLISIVLFFVVFLALNLFKKIDLEKILLISSIPVVLAGILDLIVSNQRTSGTIGQANFLSIYLVLVFLILISQISILTQQKYLIIFYLIVIGLLIIKTASLTSLICLLVGIFVLRKKIHFQDKKLALILSGVLLFLFLFQGNLIKNKLTDVYFQLTNPSQTIISDSLLIRFAIWEEVLRIILQNSNGIIFGLGSENFPFYFETNRPIKLNNLSEKYLLFDKPHNYYLEILFSYGLIYFLIFIGLIIYHVTKIKDYNYIILVLALFLFFNWLDLFLKIIFWIVIFTNLKFFEIKSNKFFEYLNTLTLFFIASYFSIFLYRDISFYFGSNKFIFSIKKEKILNLESNNPILLISSLEFLNQEEKREIFNYLIKNFPRNQAILFHLDKLL